MLRILSLLVVLGGVIVQPVVLAEETPPTISPETIGAAPAMSNAQKASYLMGRRLAQEQPYMAELDMEWLGKGLQDGISGADWVVPREEAQGVMQAFSQMLQQKAQERAQANLADGEAHLAEIAKKEGAFRLESGLVYEILKEGTGPKPKPTDTVLVHYTGKLIDGRVFDASSRHGTKPMEMNLGQVIPGWTQGISLMPTGSKWRLHIPARLAYRDQDRGMIRANSTLVFDVELVGIVGAP